MNIAIEYLLRTKIAQGMLKTPCSLLLTHVFDQNTKLVITIQSCYGKPEELIVKHWFLSRVSRKLVLPPCEEFTVPRQQLFSSPIAIVDDYKPLDYGAEPYQIQQKQSADEPYATMQEKQFRECMDTFFNCYRNDLNRLNWLWAIFVRSFFPDSMRSDFGCLSPTSQRDMIQDACPVPWKGWCMWCKQLLLTVPEHPIATELAFASAYGDKLKNNIKYQEMLKHQKPSRPSIMYSGSTATASSGYFNAYSLGTTGGNYVYLT